MTIYLIEGAVFFGNVSCKYFIKLFEADKEWLHILQISDRKMAKEVFNKLRDNDFEIITFNGYNDDLELTLTAFCKTKSREQSKYLTNILPKEYKEITITDVGNKLI